jgi:hypothetical protein
MQHDESLQTDVMRFMAIIAFCLIAILALVRNVEESESSAPPVSKPEISVPDITPAPVSEPQKRLPVQRSVNPLPVPGRVVVVKRAPAPVPAPQVKPPEQSITQPPMVAASPPLEQQEPPPVLQDQPDEEKGLSLRFASDRDFLRLLAKRSIDLYAFNDTTILKLSDMTFSESAAPGRLYELMPQTIPGMVTNGLPDSIDQPYNWGIRIPSGMEQQIRRFVDADAAGELIIDRYGDINHVP